MHRDYDVVAESAAVPSQVAVFDPELPPVESYANEPAALPSNGSMKASTVPQRRLSGVNFADMKPHLADGYTIKDLLAKNSLAAIIGPAGCGKTFFASDMAVHLASDVHWRNHACASGLVIYAALEGAVSAENRMCAVRDKLNFKASIPLKLTAGPLNLLDPLDVARFIAFVHEAESEHGAKVAAVFLDTLSRALCGADENASEGMGGGIAGADAIRLATGATVVLVHHTGKDESRGARGHSSLKAALDTEIEVTKTGSIHVATVTKQRDYPSGTRYAFTLEVVELGRDLDGDPVTTCVVRASDEPSPTERKAPSGKNQTALLAALQEWRRAHPETDLINSIELRAIAKSQGLPPKRLQEATESLIKFGWLASSVGGFRFLPEGLS